VAQGIVSLKGVRQSGDRAGNWLTREQARDLLAQPEIETTKGKRDRAILAVLLAVRDHAALLVRLIKQSSRNPGTREFPRSELASLRREIKSIDGFCLPA
jgi:hypothetical protein